MSRLGQRMRNWIRGVDRSVTPVIGTILVVAIIVVIAAAFGAVAFGFTDRLGSTETASADRCGVSEFDPEDVDGFAKSESELYSVPCVTWFDASTLEYEDGDSVSRWDDRSASRFDAVSVAGTGNPTYRSSIDGVAAVEFDSSDGGDGLATKKNASDANLAGETELSISAVVRPTSATTNPFARIGDPGNNKFRFTYNETTGPGDWYLSPGAGQVTHEPNDVIDEWTLVTYVHDGETVRVYVNGKRQTILDLGGSELGYTFDADLDIADSPLILGYTGTTKLDGAIAEVVFFDKALTDDERRSIECTMDEKYKGSVTIDGC